MKIAVFGLGYVGIVTGACLAKEGHTVVGVDISELKVDLVNSGKSPIVEEDLPELLAEVSEKGAFTATTDCAAGLDGAEMALVCVGTPSQRGGALDDRYVRKVTEEIGAQVRKRSEPLLVVFRSTMVPGTVLDTLLPILEHESGKKAGDGWDLVFHPEFLREGSSIYDFYNPPKIVVGHRDPASSQKLLSVYGDHIDAPRIECPIPVAEMVKYCDNLFHAVKVTFGNEVGQFCHALGIDSQAVMDIFCQDRKLNISDKYLRPGFAFGGSCLPKDLRAFLAVARSEALRLPMLEGVLPSNVNQIERVVDMVVETGKRTVGFYGIAFKKGTDDLRESPLLELAERLIGKGFEVTCYDPDVHLARLVGGNKSYVEERFPHIAQVLTDDLQALAQCGLILLGHRPDAEVLATIESFGSVVMDLTGLPSGHGAIRTIV